MKKLIPYSLLLIFLLSICASGHATTWYVRHDGGTATQCTGTTNAAYPGGGSGQACAVSDLFWLVSNGTGQFITATNDTIKFADPVTNTTPYYEGEQNNGVGFDWSTVLPSICGPPNTDGNACILPIPPDGTTILGQSDTGAGSCTNSTHTGLVWNAVDGGGKNPTILSGINNAFQVLDFQGSNHITLRCVEITQPDVCTLSGAAGQTITNTSASGGVLTYSFTNSSGNPPLVNQRYTITGTTNGGGIFNVTNQHLTSVTGTSSGTFTIAGSGTVSSATDTGTGVPSGKCTQSNNYANNGIRFQYLSAQGPSNLTIDSVAIVGIASRGVLGSHINTSSGDTTAIADLYIIGAGFTGWDADGGNHGTCCETVGTLNLTNLHVEWSGAVATTAIPVLGANTVDLGFTQNYGGQGDNIVQIAAGTMTFNTTNSSAKYGLQDGFDYLHLSDDDTTNPVISITNSWSEGNLGQTIKLGAGASMTAINNVSTSNCAAMVTATTPPYSLNPLGWNAGIHPADVCRASGDEWSFQLNNGTVVDIENNTTTGYGATMYDFGCSSLQSSCGTTTVIKMLNNISMGFVNPVTSLLPGSFIFNSGSGPDMFANAGSILDHNLWWTMRSGSGCGGGFQPPEETNCTNADPLLASESDINNINPALTSGSPAIVNGILTGSTPSTGQNGVAQTSPPTQGAFPFAGASTVATPTFSPVAGSYGPIQTVTISTTTPSASLIYTADGSTPTVTALTCTVTHGTLYSSPLTVSSSQALKALGCLTSSNASSVATAAYVINGAVANPICSPAAGTYASTQTVTCSSSTGSSTTVCTLNGSTPTHASPTCTSIPVSTTLTLKALSFETGWSDSTVVSNNYIIAGTVATPTFSPVAGTYAGSQSVTISTSTGGASIIYTVNGTSPTVSSGCTITNGTLYTGAVTISSTTTVKAIGCESAFSPSSIATAAYTITAPSGFTINGIIMEGVSLIP